MHSQRWPMVQFRPSIHWRRRLPRWQRATASPSHKGPQLWPACVSRNPGWTSHAPSRATSGPATSQTLTSSTPLHRRVHDGLDGAKPPATIAAPIADVAIDQLSIGRPPDTDEACSTATATSGASTPVRLRFESPILTSQRAKVVGAAKQSAWMALIASSVVAPDETMSPANVRCGGER